MLALLTWTLYAGGLYVLWSAGFRVAYGRWPMAYAMPPRDRYTWIDMGLSAAMWAYFAWSMWVGWAGLRAWVEGGTGGPALAALSHRELAGLAAVGVGSGLRIWTLVTLGPNWRMGQDAGDATHEFVKAGPYRFMEHPINTATVVVALGQVGVTGGAPAAWGLLAVTVVYHLLQGAAEAAFWKARNRV